MTESEICPICKNPKRSGTQASLTQWIAACTCHMAAEEAQKVSIKICQDCGKRVEEGRAGSFTQFIFRSDTCQCERPNIPDELKGSSSLIQEEITQELEEDEEGELEYSIDEFPYERYKPIEKLGQGTGGAVYLARDRLLNKKVAVKMLHVLEAKQLVSFHEEAKATSKLNHPSIVQVLDFGASKSGTPYMVLEYVSGISLEKKLQDIGKLDWEDCQNLFSKILGAISYAHANGIFHRDIKPSNILLEEADEELQVRLIDFGIAKVKDTDNKPEERQGKTLAGAPLYMSPDQGLGKPYDARSEIYSLGCVLFECLTGKPPFMGENALATLSMHANDPVPSIKGQVDARVAEELEALLNKALAKEPDDRFQSVEVFKASLAEIEGQSLSSEAEKPAYPLTQKPNTAKIIGLVSITSLAIVALVAFGITYNNKNSDKADQTDTRPEQKPAVLDPHVEDTAKEVIEEGPLWSEVTDTTAKGMNLTDESLKDLNRICPDMHTLKVALSPNFTGVGLEHIKNKDKVNVIRVESENFGEEGAKKFLAFPNLSQMRVYYSKSLTKEAIQSIAKIPKLEHIEMRDCILPPGAISILSTIEKLFILDITGSKPIEKKDLESLVRLKLYRLKIARSTLDDSYVPVLLKFNVQHLILTETQLTNKGLAQLKQAKKLKTIAVTQSNLITLEDVKNFKKDRPDCKVTLLDRRGEEVTGSAPLNRSSTFNIDRSDFSYSRGSIKGFNVTDEDFIPIADSYPDAKILKLSNSSVTGEGLKYLNFKDKLRTIRIESYIFNEKGARELLKFPNLNDVRIYNAEKISPQTLEIIAQVPKLTKLELQHIAKLPPTTFAILSKIKELKNLALFGSRPIDKYDLANLSKLKNLKWLKLSSTPVDDSHIPAILKINCPRIDLNQTRITDKGLAELLKSKSLKELGLGVNKNLSIDAIKKFRMERKDCRVKVYDSFGLELDINNPNDSLLKNVIKPIQDSINSKQNLEN